MADEANFDLIVQMLRNLEGTMKEGFHQLGEKMENLEDKVEMLQGSIIRLDGNSVEAMALLRMLERQERRIKALEERAKQ